MKTKLFNVLALILVLAGIQTAFAQFSGRSVAEEPENVSVIFNNGEFRTGTTSESGVAAPEGFFWSENSHDTGNTTEANSVLGYSTTLPSFRMADNFTVPAGETWIITSITTYGFQQGWLSPNTPFSGATLQIWDGTPGDAGSSVIFGDTTTDRLLSSTDSKVYAIANTVVPTPRNTDFTHRLWVNKLSVAPSLRLGPGTYWIDFATSTYNGVFPQFARQLVTPGARTQPGWNARQYNLSTDSWAQVVDGGLPSSAPDVAQDIAFEVTGTVSGGNASKFADYDGDGTTDFSVTRWAVSPFNPTTWFILMNDGTNQNSTAVEFGLRAAANRTYSGTGLFDTVLPEDYDGDGKADIAVYRAGGSASEPQSYFYFINSSTNTFRAEPWGQRFDVGTIMGDYDADGIADLAVYRPGATTGAQSYFFVRKSSDGNMISAAWGSRADRPVLGDYDGDGKQDFSVLRFDTTASGEATLYTLRSSDGGMTTTPFNYFFQFIVPGDYDGDGTTDVATIKNSVGNMIWTITRSSDGVTQVINNGLYYTDFPVQGDYNGDGKTELAVFRKTGTGSASQAYFIVTQDDGSYQITQWGNGIDNSIASIRAY